MNGERKLTVADIQNYSATLKRQSQEIEAVINAFGAGLNNLTSLGIIVGQKTAALESAYSNVQNVKNNVQTKLETFVSFIDKDVLDESITLESQQANELRALMESMGIK